MIPWNCVGPTVFSVPIETKSFTLLYSVFNLYLEFFKFDLSEVNCFWKDSIPHSHFHEEPIPIFFCLHFLVLNPTGNEFMTIVWNYQWTQFITDPGTVNENWVTADSEFVSENNFMANAWNCQRTQFTTDSGIIDENWVIADL
jgi:hypothetical protein